jgi:hypothetical protein
VPDSLDDVAERLYEVRPDEFVPVRDDAVAQAREQGDKDLARAIGRLRRPTKAAWLANLLARRRGEQLDALLTLAGDLADAQRTLDGGALRALSSQRNRLVAAMAREAGRLAYEAGDSAAEPVLRELQGILEAALADPAVAEEVRSGRMTRTVAYSGFGPVTEPGAVPTPAPKREPAPPREERTAEPDDRARQRRERERAERQRALDAAEQEEAAARERQDRDEAAREDAESAHAAAREHVADLTAELEAARERERKAASAARAAASTAKESARAAGAAATRTARARARLDELG